MSASLSTAFSATCKRPADRAIGSPENLRRSVVLLCSCSKQTIPALYAYLNRVCDGRRQVNRQSGNGSVDAVFPSVVDFGHTIANRLDWQTAMIARFGKMSSDDWMHHEMAALFNCHFHLVETDLFCIDARLCGNNVVNRCQTVSTFGRKPNAKIFACSSFCCWQAL